MEERQKRQPAFMVSVQDVLTGTFVKTEGWDPNFVKTQWGLQVSRINIIGTVIEKDQQEITVDDGTGIIMIRSFEPFDPFNTVASGDCIILIGKIRKYNEEIYVSPEICKKVDGKWVAWRKKELQVLKDLFAAGKIVQEVKKEQVSFSTADELPVEEDVQREASLFEKVLKYIEEQDKGQGVTIAMITNGFDEPIKDVLQTLIMEGDIFEIKPNTFKVLK